MKKLMLLVIMIPIWIGCSDNEDEEIDCALFDPAFPSLYIRLVDASNTNLIENGAIDPNVISVQGEFPDAGFRFIPADEFANPDADIREFDNTIQLFVPRKSTFQYIIHLSDTDAIRIDFSAELTRIPCDLSFFTPVGGVFNNEAFELRKLLPLEFLAVIEL